MINGETTIEIRHSPFLDFNDYTPEFNFRLKDIYQNCFYPSAGVGPMGSCTPTTTPVSLPYCCDGGLSATSCN